MRGGDSILPVLTTLDVDRFASSKTPVKFDVSKAVWLDEKNKQAAKSAKRLRKSD